MKQLKIVLLSVLIGVGVAITYFYFELAVRRGIQFVWEDALNTTAHRWLVVPLCLVLTVVFFGVQHLLDPKSEKVKSKGLGEVPTPTVSNFVKVLVLGFLSLVAGASLGPEAVLVPACMLLGSYIGIKLYDTTKPTAFLFGVAGFIALFVAFFNSFLVGMLAILLVKKQFKAKITPQLFVVALISAASAALMLKLLDSRAYVTMPHYSWKLSGASILMLVVLAIGGYFMTYILGFVQRIASFLLKTVSKKQWWLQGLIAGAGLSLLYLAGGTLVQFTGNESVAPLLKDATSLGVVGLVWILLVKLAAIGWSKASGYRGGLVFPMLFSASVLVAIAQLSMSQLNFIYGLIVVMVGIIAADAKVKTLF